MAIDIQDYFARKLSQAEAANPTSGGNDKFLAVEAASRRKTEELRKISQQQVAEETADAKSWIGKRKAGETVSPGWFLPGRLFEAVVPDSALNQAAALTEGIARVGTNLVNAPLTAIAGAQNNQLTDEHKAAWGRIKTGQDTAEDHALLDAPEEGDLYGSTARERLERMESLLGTAKKIREVTDLSRNVQRGDQRKMEADLKQGFRENWGKVTDGSAGEKVAGLAGLLQTIGAAAWDNPKASLEHIISNAPQLALAAMGPAGMAVTNIPYAIEEFGKGIEEYRNQNGGALPTDDKMREMALYAASLAVAETLGDKLVVGGRGGIEKAFKEIAKSAEKISRDSAKDMILGVGRTAGKAITGHALGRIALGTLEGAAGEFATEAYQTHGEGKIQGKDTTAEENFVGGAIGAIVGGPMAGGFRTVAEVTKTTPEKIEERAVEASKRERQRAAIATGDVSKIEEPTRAIAALQGNAKMPTATPETKQKNFEQATQIVEDLEAKKEKAQQTLETYAPETIQSYREQLAQIDADISRATTPEDKAALQSNREVFADLLKDADQAPKRAAQLQSQITKLDIQITEARKTLSTFHLDQQATNVDVEEKLATIQKNTDPKATSEAFDSIINLAMAAPERVDEKTIDALLSGPGLTDQQRAYVRSLKESRLTSNLLQSMGGVSEEIYTGSKENVGIAQYRERMAHAIAAGNKAQADRQIADLSNFARDHADKAAIAREALAQGRGTQFLRPKRGKWQIAKEPLSPKALRQAQGLTANSSSLVQGIEEEAKALKAALVELQAAHATKFTKPTTKGQGNVTDSARTQTAHSTASSTSPAAVQATTQAGSVAPGTVGRADGSAEPSGGVGQSSVDASKTENWNGLLVYLDTFNGMKPGDFKAVELEHIPGMFEITHITKDGLRISGSYEFNEHENWIDQFNITSESGALSVKGPVLKDILKRLVEKHPTAEGLSGTRISGARLKSTGQPVDVHFKIKNGRLVSHRIPQSTEKTSANSVDSQAASAAPVESEPTTVEGQKQSNDRTLHESTETSTEQTAETVESTVGQNTEETATPKDEPEVHPVGLRVFQRVKEQFESLNEKFLKGNLIAEYFSQDTKGDRYKTQKPLASVNDFFSAWNKDDSLALKFIENDGEFNQYEQAALENLKKFLRSWDSAFTGNLREFGKSKTRKEHADFKHRDMLQYLLEVSEDGSVDLEENVKTAMVYSAYQWILTQAHNAAFLTDAQIKAMHAQDEDSYLSADGRNKLRGMASYEHTAAFSLGEVAIQALGLKLKPDASQDMLARLKTNIGTQILVELENRKYITRENIPSREVAKFFVGENATAARDVIDTRFTEDALNSYIRFTREKDDKGRLTQLPTRIQVIRNANRGAGNIVDTLFGADIAPRIPGTKPAKFRQQYAKRTHQEITKEQRKVIQDTMNTPHTVIPMMYGLVKGLGDMAILEVAGWRNLLNGDIQKANRESIEAQNQNLELQLDGAMEMLESNPDGQWFVEQEVWKNFRAGFLNQALNMQTSKIHRFMFQRPSWEVEIDLNNDALITEYLISVGMNLGLKTDAQPNGETLDIFKKKIENNPKIQKAVDAIRRNLLNSTEDNPGAWSSLEDIGAVKNAARDAEGMMSLQALLSYAQYVDAKAKGHTSFKTTLLVGADGKTNGPILTHLALGAADGIDNFFALLNRGGFYSTDEGQADHFSEYYQGGAAMDLYQYLGTEIVKELQTRVATLDEIKSLHRAKKHKEALAKVTKEQIAAIEVITKALTDKTNGKLTSAGRNIVKTPLTAFAFGSALNKSIEGMTNGFIESIYAAVEEVNNGKRTDISEEDIFNAMNVLIEAGNYQVPKLRREQWANPMEFEFGIPTRTMAQEDALRAGFENVLGSSVKRSMETVFANFIERRRTLNKTVQASYYTYKVAFDAAVVQEQQRLMDADELPFRIDGKGNRQPLQGLTVAQENKVRESIKDLLPVMHTAYSLREGNIDAGLYMAKTEQTRSTNPLFAAQTSVANAKGRNGKPTERIDNDAMEVSEKDPGVAGTPYSIHSSDSSDIHLAMGEVPESMNIHDEIANSIAKIADAARAINKATLTTFLNYSPAREALNMLTRQLISLNEKAKSGEVSPKTVVALFNSLTENYNKGIPEVDQIEPADVVQAVMLDAVGVAHAADDLRLQAFSKLKSIDQYTWEGGQYEVTKEDRALAEKMRSELVGTPSKELRAAADNLLSIYEQAMKKGNKAEAKVEATDEVDSPPVAPKESVFGQVGTPVIESDFDVVEFFEEFADEGKTAVPAIRVIAMLKKRYTEDTTQPNRGFNMKLLAAIERIVPKDLKVNYIKPGVPLTAFPDGPVSNARGWYALRADEIYVLSPEFEASGLTPETLLHELVHAAIARIVNAPGNADAKALVDELDLLRKEAAKYAKAQQLDDKYAPALADVQEFIAWGMSNQDFQRDVLNRVTMQSKNWKNQLISGMKLFIKNLAGLIFKRADERRQEIAENGLGILIANVSGLFAEAAKTRNARDDAKLNLAQSNTAIDSYSTLELFQGLDDGSLSEEFDNHLQGILGGIVLKLHGPLGSFKESLRKTEAKHPLGAWLKALETGKAPFASQIVGSPLASSAQEDFAAEQVEATVRAALEANEAYTKTAYKQLSELYEEVRAKLRPRDFFEGNWDTATPAEKTRAKEQYEFTFKVEASNGDKSDYLARFASLGLSNQKFNSLLKVATDRDTKLRKDDSFGARLQNFFVKILEFFNGKLTRTYAGQPADAKLTALVEKLVDIEAKQRLRLAAAFDKPSFLAPVEKATKTASDAIRGKVEDIAGSAFVRNSPKALVRGAGAIARTVAGDRVDKVLDGMTRMRDREFKGRQGVVAGLINYTRGPLQKFEELLRHRKTQERDRKTFISQTGTAVMDAFINQGKDLSDRAKASITNTFVRTGAHYLLDHFSMTEIGDLVSNEDARNKAIRIFETKLYKYGNFQYQLIEQANGLGYYLATGETTPMLVLNAHNIAQGYGTFNEGKLDQKQIDEVIPTLEVLITLYSLGYLNGADRIHAEKVIRVENLRNNGENGIEFVLKLHKQLTEESKEKLFDSSVLMMHGYTPEIVDPHVSVEHATTEQGKELIGRGFVKLGELTKDPADPDQERRQLYVLKGVGMQQRLSGAISLTSEKAKGSMLHNGFMNPNTSIGLENQINHVNVTQAKMAAAQSTFQKGPRRDLSKERGSHMVPVFNEQGKVVNYRYIMKASTRDSVLRRDSRVDRVLGSLAGSVYDKVASKEQNKAVIAVLKEQYNTEHEERPESYVMIGAKATDDEFKEIWDLLPEATRDEARRVWGYNGMMVRSDLLDIIFGYRKQSLATMFQKEPGARKELEKFLTWFPEHLLYTYARTKLGNSEEEARNYARRAATLVTRGERMWQEIVRETKDIIVVKTGTVLLGNIWSNFSLLALQGVPFKDMVHHHIVAMKGATAYWADSEELAKNERLLATGYTQGKDIEIRRKIVQLKDALARNPVKKLIDAGLMPTIVEDVAQDDDPYSYKSALTARTEGMMNKLPQGLRSAARVAYMAHDTKLYQGLYRMTQLSDFVARYTLYQHLTTRKKNPLSEQAAIQYASDSFIHYDIPMHRSLQYIDDMGIIPFMKYYLGIQRVLLKVSRENPARVLTTVLLGNLLDLGPIVLDSSFVTRIGNNPLQMGALKFPTVWDDLATVSAASALLK